jgi:hypothetical protein
LKRAVVYAETMPAGRFATESCLQRETD